MSVAYSGLSCSPREASYWTVPEAPFGAATVGASLIRPLQLASLGLSHLDRSALPPPFPPGERALLSTDSISASEW